jgi:hypothetical protein
LSKMGKGSCLFKEKIIFIIALHEITLRPIRCVLN